MLTQRILVCLRKTRVPWDVAGKCQFWLSATSNFWYVLLNILRGDWPNLAFQSYFCCHGGSIDRVPQATFGFSTPGIAMICAYHWVPPLHAWWVWPFPRRVETFLRSYGGWDSIFWIAELLYPTNSRFRWDVILDWYEHWCCLYLF